MTTTQVQRRIEQVKRQLTELGPMHPGTLTEQYNVCGTPGCRCKDPKEPRKHGPYYQLSFSRHSKSTSRFVRPGRVAVMQEKVANYKRLRELVNEWVDLAVKLDQMEREQAR
jgi:uncharacterized protein DUF6788